MSGQQKLCCVFCEGQHFPTKMPVVNARKEILKNSSCYYFYLKTGQLSINCTRNYICRICNRKHHISICEEKNKQSPDQTSNTKFIIQTEQFFSTLVVRNHL